MGNMECCQPRASSGLVEVKINTEAGDPRSKPFVEITDSTNINAKPVVEICPLPAHEEESAADTPIPRPPAPVADGQPCARRLENRTRAPAVVEAWDSQKYVADGPLLDVVLRRLTLEDKFGFVNATRKDRKPVLVVASILPNTPLGLWNTKSIVQVRPHAEILSINGAANDIVAMREALRESLTITMQIQNMKKAAQPCKDLDLPDTLEPNFPGV
mmetsp:Transcript_40718/g.97701  ORF Transcript_40718/g.97701 Transcript_40718/m.97701 type:complete len:216 (-) Transcript_40718:73-720(-)